MEELPEADEESLVQTAAERFRKIPKGERQVSVFKCLLIRIEKNLCETIGY